MVYMDKKEVGEIIHFFSKISVAIIKLSDELIVGDTVSFEGATTNFSQKIESMQVDYESITKAQKGVEIGVKVKDPVRTGDKVFKV